MAQASTPVTRPVFTRLNAMNTQTPDNNPTPADRGADATEAPKRPPRETPNRPPSSRGALVIGAAATLMLVTLLIVALTSPDRGPHRHDDPSGDTVLPDDNDDPGNGLSGASPVGHIHGIAPAAHGGEPSGRSELVPSRVLIGAHHGLFAVDAAGNVSRVGKSADDYMALTAAEPHRLLASGHPEPTDRTRPANLGLMESLDGGRTWEPLSMEGKADFHALAVAPDRTWGIDSVTGALLTSTDESTWDSVHDEALLDVAVDPRDPSRLLVTTSDGRLLAVTAADDANGREATVEEVAGRDAPRLALIDWPTPDVLLGVSPDGTVSRSVDDGDSWAEVARVPGDPTAVSVIGGYWFLATSNGLFRGPVAVDAVNEGVKHLLPYTS